MNIKGLSVQAGQQRRTARQACLHTARLQLLSAEGCDSAASAPAQGGGTAEAVHSALHAKPAAVIPALDRLRALLTLRSSQPGARNMYQTSRSCSSFSAFESGTHWRLSCPSGVWYERRASSREWGCACNSLRVQRTSHPACYGIARRWFSSSMLLAASPQVFACRQGSQRPGCLLSLRARRVLRRCLISLSIR